MRAGPQSRTLREGDIITLGRDPGNDLVLEARSCSARHAEIKLEGGRLWVRDVGSSYGTAVDDCSLTAGEWTTLRSRERLSFGKQDIPFELELEPDPLAESAASETSLAKMSPATESAATAPAQAVGGGASFATTPAVG